ncbi:hypothetical protein SCOR_19045 [Sulfidibacter corallicola]
MAMVRPPVHWHADHWVLRTDTNRSELLESSRVFDRVTAQAGGRIAGGSAFRPPGFKWVTNRSESLGSSRICERGVVQGR